MSPFMIYVALESLAYIFAAGSIWVYLHSNFCGGLRKAHLFCNTVHISHSRSSQVVDFGTFRKGVCDFLLVINSNFGPILHRFWDTRLIGWKLRIFPTPLSFNAFARGEPFGTSGSPFFAKTRVFVLSVGEDFVILARFSLSASVCRTYRQTDGQTDIQIVANTGLA